MNPKIPVVPVDHAPKSKLGYQFLMYQARYETFAQFNAGIINGGGDWAITPEQAYERSDKTRTVRIAVHVTDNIYAIRHGDR